MIADTFFTPIWHWIEVHTGTVNESGPYYGFWSGFGSDIGEATLIGGIVLGVRHINCQHTGCWRPGRHTPKGYKLCRRCGKKPLTDLDLGLHEDHHL